VVLGSWATAALRSDVVLCRVLADDEAGRSRPRGQLSELSSAYLSRLIANMTSQLLVFVQPTKKARNVQHVLQPHAHPPSRGYARLRHRIRRDGYRRVLLWK